MKILKLRKVKLGDKYPVIRITYKSLFRIHERDVVKKNGVGWKWADTGSFYLNDCILDAFSESGEYEYMLNGE